MARVALVADQLLTRAGSERVFQYFCEEFPEADVYTSAYNLDTTWDYFRTRRIHPTWLNRVVQTHKTFKYAFPLTTRVMERLDLTAYDAVLSLAASVSKYVRTRKGRHVCYCLVPTRALWNDEEYFRSDFKGALIKPLLSYLRAQDYAAAQRVDDFLCISENSRQLIARHYKRDAQVIYSPIDLDRFSANAPRTDRYLLVSRLERWKKVDYAIEAFNQLGWPLDIIGSGVDEDQLRRLAKPNIRFLGAVSDDDLARAYAQAAAVIFPPAFEYGLVPLEANASGTPVIAFDGGATREILVPLGGDNGAAPTAVFFGEQAPGSLIGGLRVFEANRARFDPAALRRHAERWGIPEFRRRIHLEVESVLAK